MHRMLFRSNGGRLRMRLVSCCRMSRWLRMLHLRNGLRMGMGMGLRLRLHLHRGLLGMRH